MSEATEIDMLIEALVALWGHLIIECGPAEWPGAGIRCVVTDEDGSRVYRAPTLLEALREAAEKEAQP